MAGGLQLETTLFSKKFLRTDAAVLGKENRKYCFTASLSFYHSITNTEKKGLQYLQYYTNTNVMLVKILYLLFLSRQYYSR